MNATDIDFAAIMADASQWPPAEADALRILDAKVPELCPDCKGQKVVFCADDDDIGDGCDCANAPTVGQVLDAFVPMAILAKYAQHRVTCDAVDVGFPCTCGLAEARAAVVAVQS